MKYYQYDKDDFCKGNIYVEILEDNEDVFFDMAEDMASEIEKNNKANKRTVLICPVGPIGQYKYFVKLVNEKCLNLKNVWLFNMDEYMTNTETMIDPNSHLSFVNFMDKYVYSKIDKDLLMDKNQRIFPTLKNKQKLFEMMQELGGVDVCYGGVGINGHLAFNEPENIENDIFLGRSARVLKISPETFYLNCANGFDGVIELMPQYAITIGMKEIFSARRIYLGMFRPFQRGVVRRAIFQEPSANFPISLLQNHQNTKIVISELVAQNINF